MNVRAVVTKVTKRGINTTMRWGKPEWIPGIVEIEVMSVDHFTTTGYIHDRTVEVGDIVERDDSGDWRRVEVTA